MKVGSMVFATVAILQLRRRLVSRRLRAARLRGSSSAGLYAEFAGRQASACTFQGNGCAVFSIRRIHHRLHDRGAQFQPTWRNMSRECVIVASRAGRDRTRSFAPKKAQLQLLAIEADVSTQYDSVMITTTRNIRAAHFLIDAREGAKGGSK